MSDFLGEPEGTETTTGNGRSALDAPTEETVERRAPGLGGRLSDVSRRTFLRRGAMGVGFAAVAGAVPGLGGLLQVADSDAPAVASTTQDVAPLSAEEAGIVNSGAPLVAHITDVSSGEISVYVGERQITYQDPQLAARLLRAASR